MKKIQAWVYANMVWILIVGSMLLFTLSKINIFSAVVEGYLEKISFAILSSGVFAAVLKSIQFTGIFKNEIENIILGTDFIENRSEVNQQELWKATSKAIYKKKFPELSSFIEDRILQTYLPITKEYYYRDFVVTVNITEINENLEISYSQTKKYEVVLDESIEDTVLVSKLTVNQDTNKTDYKNELVFFEVNGKEINVEDYKTVSNNIVTTKIPLVCENGKKVFKIHSKFERKYSLKNENYKLFRFGTFTKGVDVMISYPENVCVSFFNIGNVNFFEKEHVEVKNQICRSHKNDVILPHQGFGMSFELNKN